MMKAVREFLEHVMSGKAILEDVKGLLRGGDPDYADLEQNYFRAAEDLRKRHGVAAEGYLTSWEKKLRTELFFSFSRGFRYMMDCCRDLLHGQLLELDWEMLCGEREMKYLPAVREAQNTIHGFHQSLGEENSPLPEEILEFYAYLETAGYKLSHYFGCRCGEILLSSIHPGYIPDPYLLLSYRMKLRDYLGIDPEERYESQGDIVA